MNKRELIKHIEDLPYKEGLIVDKIDISRKGLLELVKQLDEPQKVKIPQFVADWLKENDLREETLGEQSVFDVFDSLKNDSKNGYYENVKRWIDENGDLFARAWLDGYEVEKEKRYVVKVKGNIKDNMLVYGEFVERYFFAKNSNLYNVIYFHTRKELEDAGFSEVFNSPLFEVEEVE